MCPFYVNYKYIFVKLFSESNLWKLYYLLIGEIWIVTNTIYWLYCCGNQPRRKALPEPGLGTVSSSNWVVRRQHVYTTTGTSRPAHLHNNRHTSTTTGTPAPQPAHQHHSRDTNRSHQHHNLHTSITTVTPAPHVTLSHYYSGCCALAATHVCLRCLYGTLVSVVLNYL